MSTEAQAAAQAWNQRYDKLDYLFGSEPNEWLRAQAHLLPSGGRLLCVADGEGRNSIWLAAQGHRVDAFDVADKAVAKARRLADERGVAVRFDIADVDSFDWTDGAYDGVIAIFVQFAAPPLRDRLFRRMTRSLRPGGCLLLLGYTPEQLRHGTGGPSCAEQLYTPELLAEAFSSLDIQELRAFEAHLSEGPGHHGPSALIGLVARRPG